MLGTIHYSSRLVPHFAPSFSINTKCALTASRCPTIFIYLFFGGGGKFDFNHEDHPAHFINS